MTEATGTFSTSELNHIPCPDCGGNGEVQIESENITETFEIERQLVITNCARCNGSGWAAAS
jgi:DnaJ-class molecular chaperone